MAQNLIQSVVKDLQKERARLQGELHRVSVALATFGKVFVHGPNKGSAGSGPKRVISAAGRKRIAAAQRARWAKVRAAKKK
jgi:ABC-type Fe3+-hydroxamate transport system substrate-binding protein